MRSDVLERRLIRWLMAGALVLACSTGSLRASDVQFPVGSSIGLVPPPGLRLSGTAPGFHDPDNNVSMLLLELPRSAYMQVESTMTTAAARERGIVVDRRETLFTDAGTAVVSAGDDSREPARKWMMVAVLERITALVSVQIPNAARSRYPDEAIRTALATLAVRPPPLEEQLGLLPYIIEDKAGFRVVSVVNRNTTVLTDGPEDGIHAAGQPHIAVGFAPSAPGQAEDRARIAQVAFGNLPGFVERRITASEMLRVDGQPVHEIRADARDAMTGAAVSIVQWLRFGQGANVHIVAVTAKDNWSRDFPRFRTIRDSIQPRR